MHTPRVVIWTTSHPESTRTALNGRAARPRLLVPVPHGTFVLGPDPYTFETLIDGLRVVNGVRVGLVWTETTAWVVYFDGAVRGWRFGPDDFFEPDRPGRLPEGLSWLTDAVEAVRAHGVIDGLGALRVALESVGFPADATALVKIDGGEVDDAVPHHDKKWWESLFGERHAVLGTPPVNPILALACMLGSAAVAVFLMTRPTMPVQISLPLFALVASALVMVAGASIVFWSRGRRVAAFPERDVLGMSAWAREADQE